MPKPQGAFVVVFKPKLRCTPSWMVSVSPSFTKISPHTVYVFPASMVPLIEPVKQAASLIGDATGTTAFERSLLSFTFLHADSSTISERILSDKIFFFIFFKIKLVERYQSL